MQSPAPNNHPFYWDDVARCMEKLISQMRAEEYTPTTIIAVAKGGLIPAALLHQAYPKAEFVVVSASSYTAQIKGRLTKLILPQDEYQYNAPSTIIVDDICDSGDTFRELTEHFPAARYAALLLRHTSRFDVDYFGEMVGDEGWVDFPWEIFSVPTGSTPSGAGPEEV